MFIPPAYEICSLMSGKNVGDLPADCGVGGDQMYFALERNCLRCKLVNQVMRVKGCQGERWRRFCSGCR